MGRRIWRYLLLRLVERRRMERHAGRRRCTEDRRPTGHRDGTGTKVFLRLRARGIRVRRHREDRRNTPAVLPVARVRWVPRRTRAAGLRGMAEPGARLPARSRPG